MVLTRVPGSGVELTPDLADPQAGSKCLQCEGYSAKNEQFRLQGSKCHRADLLSN